MSSDHLRNLTSLMRIPQHDWVIIPLIRTLIKRTSAPDGALYGNKYSTQIRDLALQIVNKYFASLKPRGGSFAGALKANGELDPSGNADLQVVTTLMKVGLESSATSVVSAARILKDLTKDLIVNSKYGTRAVANLFGMVEVESVQDAYRCCSQLDP